MKNKDKIVKTLQYIEENLKSEITVEEIANQFNFSYYYFSRLFKGITDFTPKNYILKRKLSEAANQIINTKSKIIDIAFDYGFGTPESFTRAFHKMFGVNPSVLRKNNKLLPNRMLFPITREKIAQKRKNKKYTPILVNMEQTKLVGLQFYFDLSMGKDLFKQWQYFMDHSSSIKNRVQQENYYQVASWFPSESHKAIMFFLGLEVDNFNNIPIQFNTKILPQMNYIKFIHKGLSSKVGYTYQYIYTEWLPETDYKLSYLFNFEYYGEAHKGPFNEESETEIYIPVDLD